MVMVKAPAVRSGGCGIKTGHKKNNSACSTRQDIVIVRVRAQHYR